MNPWPGYHEEVAVFSNYRFKNGQILDALKVQYFTIGTPKLNADGQPTNAVLLLHNTTGSGKYWLQDDVAGRLFGPGQPLDAQEYFIIAPDAVGFGRSSKPSDGLKGQFPNYRYDDLVDLTHKILTEKLNVVRLKLILGISMGGMLTWLLAGKYPDLAEKILPISCQPGPMSGRNWIQRRISIEAIRNDPDWNGGMYEKNPTHFAFAAPIGPMMLRSVVRLQEQASTRKEADAFYWDFVERAKKADANDRLYQLEASMEYDPTPNIGHIKADVLTVSFEDDALNPLEIGVVEQALKKIPGAKHEIVRAGPDTLGHLSAKKASLWVKYLSDFMS